MKRCNEFQKAGRLRASIKITRIRENRKREPPVSPFDDDDGTPGPVVVSRAAYDAGMKLEAEVKADVHGPAFETARDKALKCRAAGDAPGAAFWEGVFNFLMRRESVNGDAGRVSRSGRPCTKEF
jgi:hypothetical protein